MFNGLSSGIIHSACPKFKNNKLTIFCSLKFDNVKFDENKKIFTK